MRFGASLPIRSVVRVAIATGAAIAVGRAFPSASPLIALVEAGLVGLAFLAALIVTRELGRAELVAAQRIIQRRRRR
jgi:stage V sporulation protein B